MYLSLDLIAIENEPSASVNPVTNHVFKTSSCKGVLRVDIKEYCINLFIWLEGILIKEFISKLLRVHLKCIKLIHQLPSTRCSFTNLVVETKSDLDPRQSILFSLILWFVTLPE